MCQSYSKPKVGLFWDTVYYAILWWIDVVSKSLSVDKIKMDPFEPTTLVVQVDQSFRRVCLYVENNNFWSKRLLM